MKIKIPKQETLWKPPIKPLKLVKGHGPENAEIMIVSDYPSKEELTCGKALQGSSARLVGTYLKDNEWNLDKCFKTVFIKSEFHWPKGKKARALAWECQRKDY